MPPLFLVISGTKANIANKITGAINSTVNPHSFSKATIHNSHQGGFVISRLAYGAEYKGAGIFNAKAVIRVNETPSRKISLFITELRQKSREGINLPLMVSPVICLNGKSMLLNEGANNA